MSLADATAPEARSALRRARGDLDGVGELGAGEATYADFLSQCAQEGRLEFALIASPRDPGHSLQHLAELHLRNADARAHDPELFTEPHASADDWEGQIASLGLMPRSEEHTSELQSL